MIVSSEHQLLDTLQRQALADHLGDTPSNTTPVHALRKASCRAFASCLDPDDITAVVEVAGLEAEPFAYGSSVARLWNLLSEIEGWECILVEQSLAKGLGDLIEQETGRSVRFYGDVCLTLTQPVLPHSDKAVRVLTVADRDLICLVNQELWPDDFAEPNPLLREGVVAVAMVNDQVVARAHTQSFSGRYAEISVYTQEDWRGRGLATATAGLVCNVLQERGQIPVWSVGEDNWASLKVADRLGFAVQCKRYYVIPG